MLAIRFLRQGRKNTAFYRVVLTESSRPPKSGFLKVLGWYNPHSKETSLDKEEITKWLNVGAQASNSVARLLVANKIEHKNAAFVPDAPKASKKKAEAKKSASAPKAEAEITEAIEAEEATPEESTTPATEEVSDLEATPETEIEVEEAPEEPKVEAAEDKK